MWENFAHWLHELFLEPSVVQTFIAICFCSGIGLFFGKLRIGKVSLGITFVFFTGIICSHFGLQCQQELLNFAQSAGLVMFVYALGIEVGPSFFPSLKKWGIRYNLYAVAMIVISLLMLVSYHFIFDISMPSLLGMMSGAVTNTPVLAAVQSTMIGNGLNDKLSLAEVASACAVTYPLGAVGVILAIMFLNKLKPIRLIKTEDPIKKPFIAEFEVINEELDGKSIYDIVLQSKIKFVISRVWRNGKLIMPYTKTILHKSDHLLVLLREEDLNSLETIFGKRDTQHDWNRNDIDWNALDVNMESKRIVITNSKLNGVKLGSLRLRSNYGINITRIDRAGIEILAYSGLHLQLGDRITVVGESGAVSQVAKLLGDTVNQLDKPHLISFFLGMLLGCVLGSIPLFIPGISSPIKLGLAGGPILLGILMGAYGHRFKVITFVPNSGIQILKQLGIVVYLAALGLSSGEHFIESIMQGDGMMWIVLGFTITIVPTVIVGIFCSKLMKMNFGETAGMLCGSMANPMALDYAQGISEAKHCSIAYASVYPVSMFLRIITAQVILMFFL